MGAAFVAVGQALVDAIAVGLIGDNEDAAIGEGSRCGEQERAGQELAGNERRGKSHGGHRKWKKEPPISNRPQGLIMINHGPVGAHLVAKFAAKPEPAALDGVPRAETWWN